MLDLKESRWGKCRGGLGCLVDLKSQSRCVCVWGGGGGGG